MLSNFSINKSTGIRQNHSAVFIPLESQTEKDFRVTP